MADHTSDAGAVDLQIPGYTDAVEVGRGGFGVVYRARQPDFDRTVAIKLLLAGALDDQARQRFDRERRIMGALSDHPNIVTVFGSGFTPAGQPYIAMAYMAKGSLADHLSRDGALGWREVAQIGAKLSDALEAAHRANVLHRDIKPENILVSAYGEPTLGDFGIARMEGALQTTTGVVTASVAHAAPEILSGQPPTVACDVYSLGSTVLTLLLGHPAFLRETDESIVPMMVRISTEPVPDLRPHGVPDAMCRAIESAMAKAPSERTSSAGEFGRQMRQALEGGDSALRTVTPPPMTPTPPAPAAAGGSDRKGNGRRIGAPAAILAGAVVAIGLVAVAATSLMDPSGQTPAATTSTAPTSPAGPGTTAAAVAPTTTPVTVAPRNIPPAAIVASSTAAPGRDFSGAPVTYEPGNAIDGDITTTWRTPGPGSGERLTLTLPGPTSITRVGLVPGYAKIDEADGTDRFTQNRRIRSVRWLFADGTGVVQDFEPRPELQFTDVVTTSPTVVVEILATTEPGERDFAAISEIEVHGTPA